MMNKRKILAVPAVCFWSVLYARVPFASAYFLDDSDPDKLIAVGAAL